LDDIRFRYRKLCSGIPKEQVVQQVEAAKINSGFAHFCKDLAPGWYMIEVESIKDVQIPKVLR
jgi:hypothetical protein